MTTHTQLPDYAHPGARALVALHERELRAFVDVWRRAHREQVALPATDDPDYASLDHLLLHVLLCAAGYLRWATDMLELAPPEFPPRPSVETIAEEVDDFLGGLLDCWRLPLAKVSTEEFEEEEFEAPWQAHYSVEAMVEHAVVHPMRHRYQLEQLLSAA